MTLGTYAQAVTEEKRDAQDALASLFTGAALRGLQLKTSQGELVRLDQVAEIRVVRGPIIINREQAHRRIIIMSNVSGGDLGSFVQDAETAIQQKLQLPAGYHLEWGGQYENQQRAQQRLAIVFPVSLLIIAALLYANVQNARQMLRILCIVPLALAGGIAALWLRGINLNLSACVGFIALFGIAVLNGVVMVSHINSLRRSGMEMLEAFRRGAADRLRPMIITALVASLGFIPMAFATSRAPRSSAPWPPWSSVTCSPQPHSPSTSCRCSTLGSAATPSRPRTLKPSPSNWHPLVALEVWVISEEHARRSASRRTSSGTHSRSAPRKSTSPCTAEATLL